jgi:hypothetical protein
MIIKPVDKDYRLFSVENFLPNDLAERVLDTNWDNIQWTRGEQQETWRRRQLDISNFELFQKFDDQVLKNKIQIEQELGIQFEYYPFTMWWYDEPNFIVPIHTDGHLPASMQIYWAADSDNYGTTFFEFKNANCVKYQCKFKANSGYLMLNGPNQDGSQPLQWHGMLAPVQQFRVSSYTNFGTYKLKK